MLHSDWRLGGCRGTPTELRWRRRDRDQPCAAARLHTAVFNARKEAFCPDTHVERQDASTCIALWGIPLSRFVLLFCASKVASLFPSYPSAARSSTTSTLQPSKVYPTLAGAVVEATAEMRALVIADKDELCTLRQILPHTGFAGVYVCMHVCVNLCVCVCACVCAFVCVCVRCPL